jgi:hypothetical protein
MKRNFRNDPIKAFYIPLSSHIDNRQRCCLQRRLGVSSMPGPLAHRRGRANRRSRRPSARARRTRSKSSTTTASCGGRATRTATRLTPYHPRSQDRITRPEASVELSAKDSANSSIAVRCRSGHIRQGSVPEPARGPPTTTAQYAPCGLVPTEPKGQILPLDILRAQMHLFFLLDHSS